MILITTPNGKVGSEVAKHLIQQGKPVRVGAHTVEKARAAFTGADVVPFDFGNEDAMRAALTGVTRLYLASPGEMPAEPVQRAVDLAREAGVQHIVRLSALGVEQSDNPLRDVERHIEHSGVAWTFLRPNWFMQNYNTASAQAVRDGVLAEPAGDGATGYVDARDIAAVAVATLTQDGHAGQAYALTGPAALTRAQVAEVLSRVTGREVRYTSISEAQFQEGLRGAGLPEAYVGLMTALYQVVRAGHTATVTDDVQRVTQRPATTFEQFARDHADAWR